jgi:predicted DNA-binding ribbon-helix-helix protein
MRRCALVALKVVKLCKNLVREGKTVHDLIAEIDRDHAEANLSSAIRVYILEFYRDALRRQRGP